jgi:hypothetical protein
MKRIGNVCMGMILFSLVSVSGTLIAQISPADPHANSNSLRLLNSTRPYPVKKQKGHQYRFKITLHDGREDRVTAELYKYEGVYSLLIEGKDDMYLLYPKDTKTISVSGKNMQAVVTDSCWLFQVEKGRINRYSVFPERDPKQTTAIQKGDNGKILSFTAENMAELVSDSRRALALVKKEELLKALLLYNY